MKKARTLQNRRERRKAKQSNYTRPGKSKPKITGHGGTSLSCFKTTGKKMKPKKLEKQVGIKLKSSLQSIFIFKGKI